MVSALKTILMFHTTNQLIITRIMIAAATTITTTITMTITIMDLMTPAVATMAEALPVAEALPEPAPAAMAVPQGLPKTPLQVSPQLLLSLSVFLVFSLDFTK